MAQDNRGFPHGVTAGSKKVHNAYYNLWYQWYVTAPKGALQSKFIVKRAAARRASLLRRPRV